MKRMLLEGPAIEPLSLAEAKAHLRLDGAEEDDLVAALVRAARVAVESETRRALIAQSWRAIFVSWPAEGVTLPVAPTLSVAAVRAIDADGLATTVDPADYAFDVSDGTVGLLLEAPGAARFEIDFTAGYGEAAADVPEPLRQAIRLLVAHWFEHRSAVSDGDPAVLPFGYTALVAPFRRLALC